METRYRTRKRQIEKDAKSEGPPVPEFFTGTEEEQHAQAVAIEAQTKHFSVIAKQYTKPGTTTLEFEAKSGTNAQTFDLGKAVKDQIK